MVWPSTSHTDRTGSRTSSGGCGSGRGTCSRCSARSSAGETGNDGSFRPALERLGRGFRVTNWAEGVDPFEVLISIVVSQNSTDAMTEKVMRSLRGEMAVTPATIARADTARLVRILRPAGLAPQKVPRTRPLPEEPL